MTATQPSLAAALLADDRQVNAMARRIRKYLGRRTGVSLVELSRDIAGFTGDRTWGNSEQNIVIWSSMSAPALAAMQRLVADGSIEPTATSWLVYNFDGGMLDMPIANDTTSRYDEPHWLPVVFAAVAEAE